MINLDLLNNNICPFCNLNMEKLYPEKFVCSNHCDNIIINLSPGYNFYINNSNWLSTYYISSKLVQIFKGQTQKFYFGDIFSLDSYINKINMFLIFK